MALAFAILVGLLAAVAWVGMYELKAVSTNLNIITHDRLVKVQLTHLIENEVNRQSRALRTAMLTHDADLTEGELRKIEDSLPKVSEAVARLSETIKTPQGKQALANMLEARKVFKGHEAIVIDLIKSHRIEEARTYLATQLLPPQTVYLANIESLTKTQTDAIDEFSAAAEADASTGQFSMLVLSLLAGGLTVLIAWLITRSITHPVEELKSLLTRVGKTSDFSLRLQQPGTDEIGQAGQAFNQMQAAQQRAIHEVKTVVTALSQGDFSKRVASDLNGDLADMKEAVNQSAHQIQDTMAAILAAMDSLQAGRFDVQLVSGAHTAVAAIWHLSCIGEAEVRLCDTNLYH